MPHSHPQRPASRRLSHDDMEIECTAAATGKCAVTAAVLMFAKRDPLRAGDVLRIETEGQRRVR